MSTQEQLETFMHFVYHVNYAEYFLLPIETCETKIEEKREPEPEPEPEEREREFDFITEYLKFINDPDF